MKFIVTFRYFCKVQIFLNQVKKKLKGGTSRAVQSPDYQTIYSAVIDTYTSNVTLRPWAEDEHMLQTAHIINIVNVFDRCTGGILSVYSLITRASLQTNLREV